MSTSRRVRNQRQNVMCIREDHESMRVTIYGLLQCAAVTDDGAFTVYRTLQVLPDHQFHGFLIVRMRLFLGRGFPAEHDRRQAKQDKDDPYELSSHRVRVCEMGRKGEEVAGVNEVTQ